MPIKVFYKEKELLSDDKKSPMIFHDTFTVYSWLRKNDHEQLPKENYWNDLRFEEINTIQNN